MICAGLGLKFCWILVVVLLVGLVGFAVWLLIVLGTGAIPFIVVSCLS